ncbi:hypothetical protein LJB82_03575, partial [Desulfovibrio sp. OttesenSCG-928-M16]|nr:hypothetical protein [Desulfovibrio sp. OttesenSCG-928-M16]
MLLVFSGGLHPEVARADKEVKIGAGETKAITEILAADPNFSFNDIIFTGQDPNKPGILLIDRNLSTSAAGQLKFQNGYGKLSIGSGITLTLRDINEYGHQRGGWMRGIDAIPVRIDGQGVLRGIKNRVEGDASVIFADSSVYIGDSAYFSGNSSHFYRDPFSSLSDRPTLSLGGVIYAGKDVTIGKDASFISNINEGGFGGAIYAGGLVSVGTNALFSGNESRQATYFLHPYRSDGGAIWAGKDITFAGDATLTANSASSGGALYSKAGAVTVNGSATFSENAARGGYNFGNIDGGYGGAIYAQGPVSIHGTGTFSGNTAVSSGGALYSNNSVLLSNALFSGNRAINTITANSKYPKDAYGGAIYAAGSMTIGSIVAQDNLADSKNSANDDGGALYSKSGNISINSSASFDANTAQGRGGAIAAGAGNISVTDGVFTNNWSSGHGGALFAAKGTVTLGKDSSFTANISNTGGGGAVYAPGGVSGEGGLTMRQNTAQKGGGAVWSGAGVSFASDTILDANRSNFKGGALFATGNLSMGMRSSVTGNEVSGSEGDGGALYSETGTITLDDGAVFSANKAGRDGGAVWAKKGVSIDPGATFSGNTAGGRGGAVFSEQGAISFGERLALSGNNAVGSGGAVYGIGDVTFGKNTTFENNKSTGSSASGGAVYGATVTLGDNATVMGNESLANGGALYSSGQMKFGLNALLSGNTATGGKGGAAYAYAGATFLDGAVLDGNTAGSGGAVYSEASSILFGNRVSLSNNRAATGHGGALYAYESVTLGTEALLSGNTAAGSGGAVYAGKGASFGSGGTFTGNSAGGDGGALYVSGDLSITGPANFTNNRASGKGGALYVNNGNLNLRASNGDIVFSGNTAAGGSNAVYMGGAINKKLTLSASKGNSILFENSLESPGPLTLAINPEATDTGIVRFMANAAVPGASTTVSHGALELNKGVTWGSTLGQLFLQSWATLAVNGPATLNAAATLSNGAQLSFGLAGNNYSDTLLTLAGTPTIAGTGSRVQIDLLSLSNAILTPGSYTLVAGWKGLTGYNPDLTLRGEAVNAHPRLSGALNLNLAGNGNLLLNVGTLGNLDLTWKNWGGVWNMAAEGQWKDSTSADRHFLHGDLVTFGSFWNDKDTVTVADGGVVVGDMTVNGNYTFWGGTIEANSAASTLAATGTLTVAAGAVANFSGIAGSNAFEKVQLLGTLVLGQAGHLGTTFKNVSLGANPTLRFVNNAFVFDGTGSDTQRILHNVAGQKFELNASSAIGLAFLNSSAADSGGAVFTAAGTLDIYGKTLFSANHSDADGGAIKSNNILFKDGELTVLRGNSAGGSGGAVHADGHVIFENKTLLSQNTAQFSGGGVYAVDLVKLGANSVIMQNTATDGDGGGIRAGRVNVGAGGFIYANKADTDGGAIYAGGTFTSTASNYVSNKANRAGGAIYSTDTVTLKGDSFSSNQAGQDGGAVYADGAVTLEGTVAMLSNTAGNQGGALRVNSLNDMNAKVLFEQNSAAEGGAVYSAGTVSLGNAVSALRNAATNGSGGAFYAVSAITLGDTAVLQGNSAVTSGGALYSGATIDVEENGILSLNRAKNGGAVFSTGVFSLGSGGRFLLNSATEDGGAVYAQGGASFDDNLTFGGNKVGRDGGGVYAEGAVSTGESLTMFLNESKARGGAIFSSNTITLGANAAFTANKAQDGGAIYSGTSLTAGEDSLFRGNSASQSGGAIFSANGAVTLDNGALLTGNSAGVNGGAIGGTGGSFKLEVKGGSVFANNSAGKSGGAIYTQDGLVTLNANTGDIAFANNTAGGAPNAIHLEGFARLSMEAAAGRFIYMDDPLSGSDGSTSTITVNAAADSTGTIRFSNHNSELGEVNTTVHKGVFELADGAGYGSNVGGSSFTLNGSARLRASGSEDVSIGAETITFAADSAL